MVKEIGTVQAQVLDMVSAVLKGVGSFTDIGYIDKGGLFFVACKPKIVYEDMMKNVKLKNKKAIAPENVTFTVQIPSEETLSDNAKIMSSASGIASSIINTYIKGGRKEVYNTDEAKPEVAN